MALALLAVLCASADRTLAQAASAVEWMNPVNATPAGNTIQKTGGCAGCADAGGTSVQALSAGDGYAEFTPASGGRLYAGLGSNATPNTDPALIEYAFSFWPDGGWDVRERNTYKAEGRFVAGDVFRVAIVAGTVKYYQNGALVYSSAVLPAFPLVLDTTLIGAGAMITNAVITAQAPPVKTPVVIGTTELPNAAVGQAYAAALQASGGSGAFRWSILSGSLPAGLTLDAGSGTIQGTPTAGGRSALTVRVADAVNSSSVADQALALSVLAEAPPSVYDAVVDRAARVKGAVPALGPAGFAFSDPAFGTRLMRVTDSALRPGALDRSYRTPSSTHANAWSADARYFYTVSTDGTVIPFSFDRATMRAERLQASATGDGGLTLRFFNEPTFSYQIPGVAYGTFSGSGSNLRSVDQYDFNSGQYSQLLNLDALVPNLAGTYMGGLGVSSGAVERLFAFFGGTSQDRHFYLVVFDRNNPANRHLLDTAASTIDGVPTNTLLNFKIHAANIDRSGRYVTIYPTGTDLQAPRSAAPAYVWDVETGSFTALPLVAAVSGGHDAFGYGDRVNQDCCASTTWDAAQWQYRSLATPLSTFDLITPVLSPKEVYLADHPSWHNAQPDRLVPFLDANYRYGANTTPWRAWDEEIFAVQTEGAGGGGTVWRFAHHRSAVADDVDPSRTSFWYTPRVNVSPDGQWTLFTSNWEKTLGTDPGSEAGGAYRQDVFLIELKRSVASPPVAVVTGTLPAGTVSQAYSATLQATGGGGSYTWSFASGALPGGLSLNSNGVLAGTPSAAGTFAFTVQASDSADASNAALKSLTMTIAPAPVTTVPVVITTTTLPDAYRGRRYANTVSVSGGKAPFKWSKISGSLPQGLTLNTTTGYIAGTPSQLGTWSFTIRVTDSAAPVTTSTRTLSIRVRKP